MNTPNLVTTVECTSCGTLHYIPVNSEDIKKWENGMLIQNAMPYLSTDQRELLISNLCPTCFDDITGEEE